MRWLIPDSLRIDRRFAVLERKIDDTRRRLDDIAELQASALVRGIRDGSTRSLRDAEFRVHSQFGEDGIVQYLVHHTGIANGERRFVEFGVGDYTEATTRFLLVHDNWQGLVLEARESDVAAIRADTIHWRYDLTATHAVIDRDNIDGLLEINGFAGEIGLLSIDIDGNDYWVWERLTVAQPVIVVCEYNAVLGRDRAFVVPYDPAFARERAHFSHLYWGASLKALCLLGERKGYAFVGSNAAGNNAFFVRRDRLGSLVALTAEEGFVESRFRDSRDEQGRLSFLGGSRRLAVIAGLEVVDVESGERTRLESAAF